MNVPNTAIPPPSPEEDERHLPGVAAAVGLALGSGVAIGLARFAYALLLSSMRGQ
ncbi:MAG: hypothetical protein ACYDGY_09765 [Acidimicrobiales bacterium]